MSLGKSKDIGVIILAAGSSRRFGGDKRLAPLDHGSTLLETTLSRIPETLSKRILVLQEGDLSLARQYEGRWQICFAKDARLGMGHSLSAAMVLTASWQGVIIGLGDMPYVKPETFSSMQKALFTHDLVAPVYKKTRGNPVAFGRPFFAQLGELKGDRGARKILEDNADKVTKLEVDDPGILRDIDTRSALEGRNA